MDVRVYPTPSTDLAPAVPYEHDDVGGLSVGTDGEVWVLDADTIIARYGDDAWSRVEVSRPPRCGDCGEPMTWDGTAYRCPVHRG